MADFDYCFSFLMDNEDRQRECSVVPDPPAGSHAISGVNSFYWPEDFARIEALPQELRLGAVKEFYRTNFWNQWIAAIENDDLAARVLDSSVNQGSGTACKLLQQAVNSLGGSQIDADGHYGPITLAAVNNQNPVMLLNAFRQVRAAKYKAQGNDALVPRALK